jgi:branched-chain amino acid transport system permease protein
VNLDATPQLLVDGIIAASFYALLAVSWGVIFATTRTFHFAHALTLTAGAYAAVGVGAPLALALPAGMAVGVAVGIATEVGLYRPLRRRGALTLNVFLASLGLLLAGEAAIQWWYGPESRRLGGAPSGRIDIGSATISNLQLLIAGLSVAVLAAVVTYLRRTRAGLAIQAISSNPDLSASFGVDRFRTHVLVFALGSGLAGLAGGLLAMRDAASPTMGVEPLLVAFAAVFVGGIGSTTGTVLGAVLLGLAESLSGVVLPGRLQAVTTFVILFAVLLARPTGLMPREAG